jgi:hypothetical protein
MNALKQEVFPAPEKRETAEITEETAPVSLLSLQDATAPDLQRMRISFPSENTQEIHISSRSMVESALFTIIPFVKGIMFFGFFLKQTPTQAIMRLDFMSLLSVVVIFSILTTMKKGIKLFANNIIVIENKNLLLIEDYYIFQNKLSFALSNNMTVERVNRNFVVGENVRTSESSNYPYDIVMTNSEGKTFKFGEMLSDAEQEKIVAQIKEYTARI